MNVRKIEERNKGKKKVGTAAVAYARFCDTRFPHLGKTGPSFVSFVVRHVVHPWDAEVRAGAAVEAGAPPR